MNSEYSIPTSTTIGHIHLKVSDLDRSLKFYCDLLGFNLLSKIGDNAAFISAGDYHHHIGLNTWYSKNSIPPLKSQNRYISFCSFVSNQERFSPYL